MRNDSLLFLIRTRQVADLRCCFPTLSERELMQILCSTPGQAVYILQQCFGCGTAEAKAAWNDYVLRYIDGRTTFGAPPPPFAAQEPLLLL